MCVSKPHKLQLGLDMPAPKFNVNEPDCITNVDLMRFDFTINLVCQCQNAR